MKLDDIYKEKNGLGPSTPEPKKPAKAEVPKPQASVVEDNGSGMGFVDKIIAEKNAPKKVKKTKPAKKVKAQKPTPTPKPEPKVAPEPERVKKPIKEPSKPTEARSAPKTSLSINKKMLSTIVKILLVGGLVIFSLYNFSEVSRLNELMGTETGQQSKNDAKNQDLINQIGTLMRLPNSDYEVYTVKDKKKLTNDPVFEFAENGDKVVVYPADSLTIVYRESEGRIIDSSKTSSLTEKK